MRALVPLDGEPDDYNVINIDRYQLREIRNAAHAFDSLTDQLSPGRLFRAEDFVDWFAPDTEARKPKEL